MSIDKELNILELCDTVDGDTVDSVEWKFECWFLFWVVKIWRKTYVDTFWIGCADIGWVCKVLGEVLRSEMELRLELYGENWEYIGSRYRIDMVNKILVKVWMNYKKVVKFESELLLHDNFAWEKT